MNGTSPDVIVIGWREPRRHHGVDPLELRSRHAAARGGKLRARGNGEISRDRPLPLSNPEVVRMAVESRHVLRTLPTASSATPVPPHGLALPRRRGARAGAVDNAAMQDEEGVDSIERRGHGRVPAGDRPGGDRVRALRARQRLRRPGRDHERLPRGGRGRRPKPSCVRARRSTRSRSRTARCEGFASNGELIACGTVVLAAGAWSVALGRTAGVEIPLEIVREQESILETSPQETISCAVSSQADRIYMRPAPEEGPAHLLIGRGFPKEYEVVEPDGYTDRVDRSFEEDVTRRLARRVPRFEDARPVVGKVGLSTSPRTGTRSSAPSTRSKGSCSRPAAAATASSSAPRSER